MCYGILVDNGHYVPVFSSFKLTDLIDYLNFLEPDSFYKIFVFESSEALCAWCEEIRKGNNKKGG